MSNKLCPLCGQNAVVEDGLVTCEDVECPLGGVWILPNKWNSRPIEDDLNNKLEQARLALADMFMLIEEHGNSAIRAHATRILKARRAFDSSNDKYDYH